MGLNFRKFLKKVVGHQQKRATKYVHMYDEQQGTEKRSEGEISKLKAREVLAV